jgi:hypothetical protein
MLIFDVATRMDTVESLEEGTVLAGTTDTMVAGALTGMVHETEMDTTAVLVA